MAEPAQQNRRSIDTSKMVGNLSGFTGLVVATVDYLWDCKIAHGWVEPSTPLIIFWATAIAPTAHLLITIFNNWLKKHAGEDNA